MKHQDPNIAGEPVAGSPDDAEQLRTFTSWKLDVLDCMSIDPRLNDFDFRLAFTIMQFMNGKTGRCHPAQDTLAELLCVNERTVRNGLNRLRDAKWLAWQRRGRVNWYTFDTRYMNAMMDRRIAVDDARRERKSILVTGKQVPVLQWDTGKNVPVPTGKNVPVLTGSPVPPNTLIEHRKVTPHSMGVDRKDIDRGHAYVPPSFESLEGKEGSK